MIRPAIQNVSVNLGYDTPVLVLEKHILSATHSHFENKDRVLN